MALVEPKMCFPSLAGGSAPLCLRRVPAQVDLASALASALATAVALSRDHSWRIFASEQCPEVDLTMNSGVMSRIAQIEGQLGPSGPPAETRVCRITDSKEILGPQVHEVIVGKSEPYARYRGIPSTIFETVCNSSATRPFASTTRTFPRHELVDLNCRWNTGRCVQRGSHGLIDHGERLPLEHRRLGRVSEASKLRDPLYMLFLSHGPGVRQGVDRTVRSLDLWYGLFATFSSCQTSRMSTDCGREEISLQQVGHYQQATTDEQEKYPFSHPAECS